MISLSIAVSLDCQISDTLQGAGGMGNTLNIIIPTPAILKSDI